MKLSEHQISEIKGFLGVDIDLLKGGLVRLALIGLQSQQEMQYIFEKEFFYLFDQLLELLDDLKVDKELNPHYIE
jgi:hypothetical protein